MLSRGTHCVKKKRKQKKKTHLWSLNCSLISGSGAGWGGGEVVVIVAFLSWTLRVTRYAHPSPVGLHVQVQVHCIGREDCVRHHFQLPHHVGIRTPSSKGRGWGEGGSGGFVVFWVQVVSAVSITCAPQHVPKWSTLFISTRSACLPLDYITVKRCFFACLYYCFTTTDS